MLAGPFSAGDILRFQERMNLGGGDGGGKVGRAGLASARHVSGPRASGCPPGPPRAAAAATARLTGSHPASSVSVRSFATGSLRRAVSGLRPERGSHQGTLPPPGGCRDVGTSDKRPVIADLCLPQGSREGRGQGAGAGRWGAAGAGTRGRGNPRGSRARCVWGSAVEQI